MYYLITNCKVHKYNGVLLDYILYNGKVYKYIRYNGYYLITYCITVKYISTYGTTGYYLITYCITVNYTSTPDQDTDSRQSVKPL